MFQSHAGVELVLADNLPEHSIHDQLPPCFDKQHLDTQQTMPLYTQHKTKVHDQFRDFVCLQQAFTTCTLTFKGSSSRDPILALLNLTAQHLDSKASLRQDVLTSKILPR